MENRSFKVNGIINLMEKNYGVSRDKIDVYHEIDNKLSMAENWRNIKPKVLLLSGKSNNFSADKKTIDYYAKKAYEHFLEMIG